MKKSKASGIIAFKTAEDAAAAVSDLRKGWSEEGRKVFIKNLHGTIDDKRLRQLFSQFGIITSARVIMDEEGKSKGFGFIGFSSPDEATEAITEMNGRTVCRKTLYVDLARGKKRTSWQIVDVQSSHQLAPQLNTLPSEKGNYRRTGSNKKKASISISKENTCSGKSKSLNIKQDSNKAAVHLPYQSTSSQNMLHLTRARLSSLVIPLPNNQKRKS